MSERFVLLHGTPDGPTYLAWIEAPDYADAWTSDKADARHFTDRDDAERIRKAIVLTDGITVAVVPLRAGPGPDRPMVHSYAEAQHAHRVASAELAALQASASC